MSGLWPREHGAYAQLGFPLLTGLVYGGGDPAAFAFAVVAIAGFLAHEPVAILTSVRGARLKEQLRRPARRRLVLLTGIAAVGSLGAVLLAPARAWLAAALPAVLAALLLPTLGTRRMKSIPAELGAVAVFSAAVLPLALSGPVDPADAGIAAATWFAAFVPAVFAVHAIKAALRRRPGERWLLWAAPLVAALSLGAVLAGAILADARELLAAAVPVTVILALDFRPPHPRHLKRVGWTLVAANAVALILLLTL